MCSQRIRSIESDFTTPLAGEACLRSEMALHVASLSVCSCVRYFRRTEPRKIDIFVSRCLLAARSRSFFWGGRPFPHFLAASVGIVEIASLATTQTLAWKLLATTQTPLAFATLHAGSNRPLPVVSGGSLSPRVLASLFLQI